MNASTGFFAVALATNLRYLPHALAWLVTQMSAGRLRSRRKLRSRSAACSGYRDVASTLRSHALTTFNTRSPSRTANDQDVQPRVWPAVTCAVSAIGPTRIVSPSLNLWSTRAAGEPGAPNQVRALNGKTRSGSSPPAARESAFASLAHNWAPDACWSTVRPPPWSGCASEFRSTLTSLMLKPSFAMLAMIIGAVLG